MVKTLSTRGEMENGTGIKMISGFSLCLLFCAARRACSGVPPCAMIFPRTRATQRPAYGEAGVCLLAVTGFFSSVISGRWFIFFQIHKANEGQVSVILVEIETIAEDEFVGNVETGI